MKIASLTAVLMFALSTSAVAKEEAMSIKSFDGFELDGKVAYAGGQHGKTVKSVAILIHGSGQSSMDADLTSVSENKAKNLLFKDFSDALVKQGFTVIRYNKRNYQLNLRVKKDPTFAKSPIVAGYVKAVFRYLVDDARAVAGYAAKRFPNAGITLMGFSEGTSVALRAANQEKIVTGVALVGFYATSLGALMLEQMTSRNNRIHIEPLDKNRDRKLSADEMKGDSPLQVGLRQVMAVGDMNGDGALDESELSGMNVASMLGRADAGAVGYASSEAMYPSQMTIIGKATIPIAFFQGALDNQCQLYHVRAVQFLNKVALKRKNLHFHIYEGRGHILDKRKSFSELVFRPLDAEILGDVSKKMKSIFGAK
jgi:pimeloyl-ACP methyl ester carboxylesterase